MSLTMGKLEGSTVSLLSTEESTEDGKVMDRFWLFTTFKPVLFLMCLVLLDLYNVSKVELHGFSK